jgi:hypothetical protein
LCVFSGGFERGQARIQVGRCFEQRKYRSHRSSPTVRSSYYRVTA